ncbi:MAG: hypothetical protein JOZ29_07335, partial [Deltaproteobacteria bacterium]|nr:hypothetical protein [Deltaproteobacteria bacterium]
MKEPASSMKQPPLRLFIAWATSWEMKQRALSLLTIWGISTAILFSLYCGLYILGFRQIELRQFLPGVAVFAVAFAILLQLDREAPSHVTDASQMSAWGLIYELFVRRKSLLAVFVLGLVTIAVTTYYVTNSIFSVEYTGEGVSIRLASQTIYYLPINPIEQRVETGGQDTDVGGWQDTQIDLTNGDVITYELSGSVSPGYLQSFDELQKNAAV